MSKQLDHRPNIVVGVDGSDDSMKAVRWVRNYADITGAHVTILTAWEWPAMYGASVIGDDDLAADAHAVAEKAAVELGLPADQVTLQVEEATAREALANASKHADLLVVGCKGRSAVARLLLGSVSSYCVHHSAAPIVVVR